MTQTAQISLKARYGEAMQFLNAGKRNEALAIFGSIHDANPNIAEVEFQIGRIFTSSDQFDRAIHHASAAARLAPNQVITWTAYAETVALSANLAARQAFLHNLQAAQINPDAITALAQRFGEFSTKTQPLLGGLAAQELSSLLLLTQAKRPLEASAQAQALQTKYPQSAILPNICGTAFAALGQSERAIAAFRQAISLDPTYSEARANLAQALAQDGKTGEAVALWRAALSQTPDLISALAGLGQTLAKSGQTKASLHWLTRAAQLAPDHIEVLQALGQAYTALREPQNALGAFQTLAKLTQHKDAQVLLALAQTEAQLNLIEAAETHYNAAQALSPHNAQILGTKAVFLEGLGRFDESKELFLKAIAANPAVGENYRLYFASHKAGADEPLIPAMKQGFSNSKTSDLDRMAFGFAMAKVCDDRKEYDQVFDYLDPANALMRKLFPYDVKEREDQIAGLIEAFKGMDWNGMQLANTSDAAPIFVTGMPRSGTTLIEQIISSHSLVTGAGELGEASVSPLRLLQTRPNQYRPAHQIPQAQLAKLGKDYAAMIAEKFPQANRITDKSILTYLTMGLMRLALPNARFIVVRRDPRDNLLSIYKNVFPQGTHGYAYNQVDLARHYTGFVKMIDFWRSQIPTGFHEIAYEDLINDPEPQSRALIQACNLDWEDACLNFHENKRRVQTLSVFQARQPISKGSLQAWQRYGDRLDPMIKQLTKDGHIKG